MFEVSVFTRAQSHNLEDVRRPVWFIFVFLNCLKCHILLILANRKHCQKSIVWRQTPVWRNIFALQLIKTRSQIKQVAYFRDNDLLLNKWNYCKDPVLYCTYQIVDCYATCVQTAAGVMSHETMVYGLVTWVWLRHIRFWNIYFGLVCKKSVSNYCLSCHLCENTGKPDQTISPAPLCSIPVIGEPFEHVLVDWVGLLPKLTSGNQVPLTFTFMALCKHPYPERVAEVLRNLYQ